MTITFRAMTAEDWPAVEAIYRDGIATGNATFGAEPPSWSEFDASKVVHPRLREVRLRGRARTVRLRGRGCASPGQE